ncbi:MAG: phosphatidate cytidylyltransferase, partial [Pseudomonadota bacterium]|nr:phosphatidate cytidylyltransferase [Pseudomonadota bacterium]
YCALVLALAALSWGLLGSRGFLLAALALVCLFWCYVLMWLRRYAAAPNHRDPALLLQLAGLAVLLGPWIALLDLHGGPGYGPGHVLFLMALVWIADSGAYFSGRRWGRRKLAPAISPGKTREGGIGALVVTLAVALVGAMAFGLRAAQWPLFVLVCLVTVAFSIAGDLFESMAKRQRGVKDSGSLLPGHGGMMDRLDSLTAAAPVFLFGLQGLTP